MARQQDTLNQVVNRVNDFNRRIRDLEEKIRNMNARVNTLDDSLLDKTQSLSDDVQDLEDEVEEVRDRIANMEVDIKEINREKRKFVSEQQLDEMENFMELMNPLNSNFVTKSQLDKRLEKKESVSRQEVEKIIDRKIKSKKTESITGKE